MGHPAFGEIDCLDLDCETKHTGSVSDFGEG